MGTKTVPSSTAVTSSKSKRSATVAELSTGKQQQQQQQQGSKSNPRKKPHTALETKTNNGTNTNTRATAAFNAENDATCIAVRRMFESGLFDPSVEGSQQLSRNAKVEDENGNSLDCGHLLYALRTKYREENPSALVKSRLKALSDLPRFLEFMNAKVTGKAPRASSDSTLQREPALAVLKSCNYVLENVTYQLAIRDAQNQADCAKLDYAIWNALSERQVEHLVKVSQPVAEEILFHATEFLDASIQNNANMRKNSQAKK